MSYGAYGSYDPYAQEQMPHEEGALCQTCFRGVLALQYGVLVCDACGETVAFLEETQEMPFYASGVGTRFREQSQARGAVEIRRVAERQKTVTKDEVNASVDAYVGLMRDLLVEGVRRVGLWLVSDGPLRGMECVVEDVLWRWVLVSGVLEEHGIEGVVEEVNRSTSERDERHVVFERYLTSRLPLRSLYAILLVSCVIERHPIDSYDITALFASTGALRASDTSLVEANLASRDFLCFDGVPNPVNVYMDMKELVQLLGIKLPPLNIHGWLARYHAFDEKDCVGSVGAQVMAGLYGSQIGGVGNTRGIDGGSSSTVQGARSENIQRRKRADENQLLPWTVLASARGFLGEVRASGEDLLLPHDAQFVAQRIGRERLRDYGKWFVARVGEDPEDTTFDFILEKMERCVLDRERGGTNRGMLRSVGMRARTPMNEATTTLNGTVAKSTRKGLPWCYVRHDKQTKLDIDRVVLDNELEVRYEVDGSEPAAKARWLEFVAAYEAKQEEVARRAVELAETV